jgi:hypothetical protein
MKRLAITLIASLTLLSGTSQANPHHMNRHGHYHNVHRADWIAPLVIGSVVTYALTRPAPQPVIVQQPQQVYPNIPPAPIGYHYENILDANCNCYRLVLVSN